MQRFILLVLNSYYTAKRIQPSNRETHLRRTILPSLGIFFVILWVHEQASPLSFPAAFNPFIKANHNSKRKELGITQKKPTEGKEASHRNDEKLV